MSERTQLQDAAALLALHTDAELDALRETYHKQDMRREAERCVNWWNNKRQGAVRWKQTYTNWLKKGAVYYAYGTAKQGPSDHEPLDKFAEQKRELERERSRRAGVS